jgi:hypothetical protein
MIPAFTRPLSITAILKSSGAVAVGSCWKTQLFEWGRGDDIVVLLVTHLKNFKGVFSPTKRRFWRWEPLAESWLPSENCSLMYRLSLFPKW